MAKPIKETPILKGKDAKKFLENKNNSSRDLNSINKEKERILKNYNLLRSAEKSNQYIGA